MENKQPDVIRDLKLTIILQDFYRGSRDYFPCPCFLLHSVAFLSSLP